MNRFIVAGVSIYFASMSVLAMAATPVATRAKMVSGTSGPGSAIHAFNERLRADMMQINKDLKAGKLTKAQAESARAQVKSIRKQELVDFKTNGKPQLTADQASALNSQLDQIQSSL